MLVLVLELVLVTQVLALVLVLAVRGLVLVLVVVLKVLATSLQFVVLRPCDASISYKSQINFVHTSLTAIFQILDALLCQFYRTANFYTLLKLVVPTTLKALPVQKLVVPRHYRHIGLRRPCWYLSVPVPNP
jgi:hypothetical protein